MKAEIIATGTEILLGEIVDTNTAFLAGELALLGIDVHFTSSIGDNYDRLSGVLRQAWQRSDIVITTGGLGPTQGDITRNVIAAVMGEEAYIDDRLKQTLIECFSKMGIEMPENNIKQATLIHSAEALLNPLGTAPGWWVEKNGRIIIALPGPPGEVRPMWRSQIVHRLQKRSGTIIISRVLKTWGLSEGKVDDLATPFLSSVNPTVAIYARQDGIVLRITAKSTGEDSARKMIAEMEASISHVLGNHTWGVDEETIASVVGRLLADKGLTLAVCESMTGGFLTYTLASTVGNSPYFRGGIVADGNDAKIALGLEPALLAKGARRVRAAAIASLARGKLNADIGIGLDGDVSSMGNVVSGEGMPLGKVFIAVDMGSDERNVVQDYSWRPSQLARRATQQALFTLHNLLLSW
ncbi:CinA family nicotinamide mononucleotide deamidase-related protein [Chloroflexota bacterium]